ncbi:putative atp-dependent rna helicase dbp9 protein [Zalerion maritima]|uniref:RNA helicase n=1 Tax=Zalerion maritima TaxID=339359 RepID=A0AAD5RN67_9PEZI|nr:putative atp-dependent rna helicase dbp9 protein [Zalerion maritima]
MKRKLDQNDEPAPGENAVGDEKISHHAGGQIELSFSDFDLDPRLLQALAKQKFRKPTLVQQKAIPLALDMKDVLAKAKTGSGKTAAYVLPILQSILQRKRTSTDKLVAALILVPTRELADQVLKVVGEFAAYCFNEIRAVNLADKQSDTVQRALLSGAPDIVVSTPTKALANVQSGALSPDKLSYLVLDEADLVMSYGYEDDLQKIAQVIPTSTQKMLTSATLSSEVDSLKGLFCRNPMMLDLEEPDEEGEGVAQYYTKCGEDEKFILAYIIMKLKLIKGKCIIFVSDVDRCYRLKLFFEQFGIRSCVLNSQLPVNSRIHVVEEFNRNVYDIIIASDEHEVIGDEDSPQAEKNGDEDGADRKKETGKSRPKKKRKTSRRDKEYGVSRGIDFRNVAYVFNFDLPTSSRSYTHRIGRTARAGRNGMALSFVVPKDLYRKHPPTTTETAEDDEKVLSKIIKHQEKKGKEMKPYTFDMAQVNNFRYRANDALRAVTKVAIREARTRELRQELIKSEKLKRHFEENPTELRHLRHDGELRAARTQPHLKHVPDYLLPKDGRKALTSEEIGYVSLRKHDAKDRKGRVFRKGGKGRGTKGARRSDPLKSFKMKSKGK